MSSKGSIAENPWVKLFIGPLLIVICAGFAIYFNDQAQDDRIRTNNELILQNSQAIKDVAAISTELPLLRQAIESNNELTATVIETVKRDILRIDNRLTTYIQSAGERERALEARIRELETHSHSAR